MFLLQRIQLGFQLRALVPGCALGSRRDFKLLLEFKKLFLEFATEFQRLI